MYKKVSIIIPCYNQGKYIKYAIESALDQTYKDLEIICVNDGSRDNSSKIIKELAEKYKNILYFELEKNLGVINARNLAIDSSSGEYILPLDADDTIEPTYVEKAVNILDNNTDIGIVYCKAKLCGNKNKFWNLPDFNIDNILYENCIFNCALFRKIDFIQAGKYKENMKDGCEDWDLWLSFIELGLRPYRIDEVLFNYRQIENSRTKHAANNLSWRTELIKNHISLYLNNTEFSDRVFSNPQKLKIKIKKYKKIFKLLIVIMIFTLGGLIWKTILS